MPFIIYSSISSQDPHCKTLRILKELVFLTGAATVQCSGILKTPTAVSGKILYIYVIHDVIQGTTDWLVNL